MLKRLIIVCLILVSGYSFGQSAAKKYINTYKDAAIQIMNEQGVPASIILGVAMHESGSGTSKLARHLNNHFGIKGKNKSKKIRSAYKGYESVADSYKDFAGIITRKRFFNKLKNNSSSSYITWVKSIQKSGYAKDPAWATRVLNTIKKYKLHEFDGATQATGTIENSTSSEVKNPPTS